MEIFFHLYGMQYAHARNIRLHAAALVGAQFLLLAWLVITTRFRWNIPSAVLIVLAAWLLGWAVWEMRRSRLRVTPIPAYDAVMMTDGPYRFIRHPMYTSLLLGGGALLIMHFNIERLVVLLLLAAVLIAKLSFEERLLCERFPGYREYMRKTARLLPYVF
jgi:protein-S-isoprenylcysteine O-methyltransferase Ste14